MSQSPKVQNTRKPSSIIEFGSGLSTLMFATYATQRRGETPRILSIEHDKAWLRQTEDRLRFLGLDERVHLFNAPIAPLGLEPPFDRQHGYLVDIDQVRERIGVPELILIDGPPSTVGRVGTFPLLLPLLAQDTTILLDDASRPAERAAIAHWVEYCQGNLRHNETLPVGGGLARLTWQPPPFDQ